MADHAKARALRELFRVPEERRDADWRRRVAENLPDAAVSRVPGKPLKGPGGFLYAAVQFPDDEGSAPVVSLSAVAADCLSGGYGLVLNPSEEGADCGLSFGEVWGLVADGTPWPDPGPVDPPGTQVLEEDRDVMVGSPGPDVLPDYARKAAAEFLRFAGVSRPQVLLLSDPAAKPQLKLAFNAFPEDFAGQEEFQRFVDSFTWFFPANRCVVFFSRDNPVAGHFKDLEPGAEPEPVTAGNPLFDWLLEDVARLRREGKGEVASGWERYLAGGIDRAGLDESASAAARAGEPKWELFFRHWAVQQGLFREPRPLGEVLDEAVKLKALAATPANADCPQRFCAHESLFNAYFLVDPKGYAEEVARACERLAAEIPDGLGCRNCFRQLRIDALFELGRLEEAEAAARRLLEELPDDDAARLNLCLKLAQVQEARGDADKMEAELDGAREFLEGDDNEEVNEDNRWGYWEMEVRLLLARGDLAGAKEALAKLEPSVPELSLERVRLDLCFSRAEARAGRFGPAEARARKAAEAASRRGMLRLEAEAWVAAAEAAGKSGDDASRASHAARLAALLPRLLTRDLDGRAAAVGARPPVG